MYPNQLQQITSFLDIHLPQKTTIVVGVSGGPDSMFLASCLQEYYEKMGWEQKYIVIAHYNHGQRKESAKEQTFLKKYFQYNTFYRNPDLPRKGLGETALRQHRHEFLADVLKQSKSKYLFLGHNLTDRIETSLMNMVRGAAKDGILGIKPTQNHKTYTIYRPLLDIEKDHITQACKKANIPYFVDATNKKNITARNVLRNSLVPQIQGLHDGGEKNRAHSRRALYNLLEGNAQTTSQSHTHSLLRTKNKPHSFWQAKHRFSASIQAITDHMIMSLFKDSYYATTKTLHTIKDFIHSSQGHLHIGGWYIFKAGSMIHCIDGKKDFWKEKHTYVSKVTQHGNTDINGYTYNISKQRQGYSLRYPKSGDTYKKKRLLKVLLNMKVPVFMRNTTLLVVDKNSIISILPANVIPSNL